MSMPSHRDTRGAPPFNRSSRSWTDQDGNRFTVNSFSTGSGMSFGGMTGSSGEFTMNHSTHAPPRKASIFSNAFSMVEDMIAFQQQQRAAYESNAQSRKPKSHNTRAGVGSETDGEDDGLAYGQHRVGRRKSVISRIKERLLDGRSRSPRKEESASSSQEESPAPSPRIGRRATTTHRADHSDPPRSQQRSRPSPIHIVVEHHEEDDSEEIEADSPFKEAPSFSHGNITALNDTVEFERRALRACKKKLEQASRQPKVTSSFLQRVIDDIKGHERALLDASDRLNAANSEQRKSGIYQAQARPRPQTHHPHLQGSQYRQNGPLPDGGYFPAFTGFQFEPPHSVHNQHYHNTFGVHHEPPNPFNPFPRLQSFGDFENFFGHVPQTMGDDPHHHFHFFDQPEPQARSTHSKRPRYSQGPPPTYHQSHQFPAFTPPATPPSPQPPSSLLKPAEAQKLFQKYNARWKALLPTDPVIPFPARGMKASSLSERESLWAPRIKTDISNWNEETVMQANVQAFYLGVVGLKPEYIESSHGQVECGFERTSASPEQIKQLVDLLKKEKPRWHSDRLGRRNGGVLGGIPNEALQKDVRARAVFHAVCELMNRALE